jgi:Domain of unknown function (DUF4276)
VTVRIYVEGGGPQASTKSACRQAFRLFFQKVVEAGSFKVIACGGRNEAFQDFRLALKQHSEDCVILLVDSEEAVTGEPWEHLTNRVGDNWQRPSAATNEQAQLMVQSMEAWFLADRPVLNAYYGQGFLGSSLPGQPNIENISKEDVLAALEHASKRTSKGAYHKTRHGFDLLELIDPNKVRLASSHAKRLFTVLSKATAT